MEVVYMRPTGMYIFAHTYRRISPHLYAWLPISFSAFPASVQHKSVKGFDRKSQGFSRKVPKVLKKSAKGFEEKCRVLKKSAKGFEEKCQEFTIYYLFDVCKGTTKKAIRRYTNCLDSFTFCRKGSSGNWRALKKSP